MLKGDKKAARIVNRALKELDVMPFCEACRVFHEPESKALCFELYFGPGGYVGHYGDGMMPDLDPSSREYRHYEWEDD